MEATPTEQPALSEASTDGGGRTISVARRRARIPRIKIEYSECVVNGTPRLDYDAALARELLARTVELPSRERDLLAVLTEYRHALVALAVEPDARGSATLDDHVTTA